jgi:hypothetical protein
MVKWWRLIFLQSLSQLRNAKQQSYIKFEGSKGAIKINFGALIDYPRGAADSFEYVLLEEGKNPNGSK